MCCVKQTLLDYAFWNLQSSEIYKRGKCWSRDKDLNEMKKHLTKFHLESTSLSYIKMERDSESEATTKYYSLSEV